MEKIDARGLSCPEPVLLLANAMKSKADSYELWTDCAAAYENVSRHAAQHGYEVTRRDVDDYSILTLTKK